MDLFQEEFESLGFFFPTNELLEDLYFFSTYYDLKANQGIASMFLKGAIGSGKTVLTQTFQKYLGGTTEYFLMRHFPIDDGNRFLNPSSMQLETLKTRLWQAIEAANHGKKVVFCVEGVEQAQSLVEEYLTFLNRFCVEVHENLCSLTLEGRKNFYMFFIQNTPQDVSDSLLNSCLVVTLPILSPEFMYKLLVNALVETRYDEQFFLLVWQTYTALYQSYLQNPQLKLPSFKELLMAITSDTELYQNKIELPRRINTLIRRLGKDEESREQVKRVLLHLHPTNLELREKEIQTFKEKNELSPKTIRNLFWWLTEDPALAFLEPENREKITEIGVITHTNRHALKDLFQKVKARGNPNSQIGFLYFEQEDFIGLTKKKDCLVVITNKECISPRLFMYGLSVILAILYDPRENRRWNDAYYSPTDARNFKFAGLNAKVLSAIPLTVLEKMRKQQEEYLYQAPNLKIRYRKREKENYFWYFQQYQAEPIYSLVEKLCQFNPELALLGSVIPVEPFCLYEDRALLRKQTDLVFEQRHWEQLKEKGWDVLIEEFPVLPMIDSWQKDSYVFNWVIEEDLAAKKMHVYPKYQFRQGYVIYTNDQDFLKDEKIASLDSFQQEILLFARSIFGNFLAKSSFLQPCFSPLTIMQKGKNLDEENRQRIIDTSNDLTAKDEFIKYYDQLSHLKLKELDGPTLKRTL